jgi:L-ascorbate metabolism protein UlaG (beta-lactamase superfamily)
LPLTLTLAAALAVPVLAQSGQGQGAPPSSAQAGSAPAADTVPGASGGPITIAPAGHASVQVSHGGVTIDVDPTAGRAQMSLRQPDVILVTDIHGDHMHAETIAKLRGANTTVIGPAAVAESVMNTTTLANGASTTVRGVTIEAVPMYNLVRGPSEGQLFHTKGRGNGYILTIGGKRLYFAGDTECTPEMKALQNIDVAFLPMNLPYTMTPSEAADCARAFKPAIVYPYHYRGQNLQEFAAALQGAGIEVRLREWYPAGAAPAAGRGGDDAGRGRGTAPEGSGAPGRGRGGSQ